MTRREAKSKNETNHKIDKRQDGIEQRPVFSTPIYTKHNHLQHVFTPICKIIPELWNFTFLRSSRPLFGGQFL